jgi:hypothetical protein
LWPATLPEADGSFINPDPAAKEIGEVLPRFLGKLFGHVRPARFAHGVLEDALSAVVALGDEVGKTGIVKREAAGKTPLERGACFVGMEQGFVRFSCHGPDNIPDIGHPATIR